MIVLLIDFLLRFLEWCFTPDPSCCYAVWPAVITAGGALLGTVLGTSMQSHYNREAWQEQNKYNSPVNQMQLYKNAGFNPATVFSANGKLDSSADAMQTPDVAGNMTAGVGAAAQSLSMAALKQDLRNKKLEGENLLQDARGKSIDNEVKAADAKEQIARAESLYEYGNEYVDLPKPESDHPWQVDDSDDYWYYLDETGHKVYASEVDWNDFDNRFKNQVRRRQYVSYDYQNRSWDINVKRAQYRMDTIKAIIDEVYGGDIANKTISKLESEIDNLDENTKSLRLDNEVFENLGFGGHIADSIIRLIVGALMRR